MTNQLALLRGRINDHLAVIYPEGDNEKTAAAMVELMGFEQTIHEPQQHANHWDESDVVVIAYGDSVQNDDEKPLITLRRFLRKRLDSVVSGVHILPFYPYTSDDGFSVIDYCEVNESLGDWGHIQDIAGNYKLMADLVINHCSARSGWFDNYKKGVSPGAGYFFEASPSDDLSAVTRPRATALLREVSTTDGDKNVWCTFSHDQVDLNFANPEVLLEFVKILRFYLDQGVQLFRFDAVAFIWKVVGTPCINLPETHEIVRLLRTLAEHYRPDAVIITETNIPSRENLSYFGNGNEAHMVYNFSLPPLLVNTLITGDCQYLNTWLMGIPPAQPGTTYFNFIASHDGIGLRPAEGLLDDSEIDRLVETMQQFGGRISWRSLSKSQEDGHSEGQRKPYEINISLFDALKGTIDGPDSLGLQRFVCAHAVMLALEGLPAFYIHSLLGTKNDYERLDNTSHNRSINRHKWNEQQLDAELENSDSDHSQVLGALSRLIAIRKQQPAFHPNALQFTLQLGAQLFGFWRQTGKGAARAQDIFVVNNITDRPQPLNIADLNLMDDKQWSDLISDKSLTDLQSTLTLAPYQTMWISNG